MSEVIIHFQKYFNEPGMKNDTFGLHRIEIRSATSDHLVLPRNLIDVQMFSETVGASLPTFYQHATLNTDSVAIDGATAGNKYWIASRHTGIVNQGDLTP